MPKDYDDFFAKVALHNKLLSSDQLTLCRTTLRQLEEAGMEKSLALVAVDSDVLPREKAERVIAAINRKIPGKHPPLKEPAAVAAAATAAPPRAGRRQTSEVRGRATTSPKRVSGSAAAVSRPSARATEPRKKSKAPLLLAGAGILVAGTAAFFALNGGGDAKPQPGNVAKNTPPATPDPKPVVPAREPKPPTPAPAESHPPAEPKPAPVLETPQQPPADKERSDMLARLAQKKKDGLRRLEEAKEEVAEDRKTSEAGAAEARNRLKGKPLSFELKAGEKHPSAVIRSYTFTDVEIDSGGKTVSLPWGALTPESIHRAADAVFDPSDAEKQFEKGRFLIANRFWKEARTAFENAVKIDDSLEEKYDSVRDVLDRAITGQGSFQGAASRSGGDALRVVYDFKSDKQLEDFTRKLKLEGTSAILESGEKEEGRADVALLNAFDFHNEIDLDLNVAADAPVVAMLFAGDQGGYEVEFGPSGVLLFRIDPKAAKKEESRKELAKGEKAKQEKGKPAQLRIHVRDRKFKVFVDRVEVLDANDLQPSIEENKIHGVLAFGIEKGKMMIAAPLVVAGRAEPRELDKHFGEIEVLVRRAVDPDLVDVEELRVRQLMGMKKKAFELHVDDPYFIFRIKENVDLARYDSIKKTIVDFFRFGISTEDRDKLKSDLDEMIQRYPDVPSLHHLRGLFRARTQDVAGAEEDVKKALEIFPDFPEALTLQAEMLYYWNHDFEAALARTDAAIGHLPSYADAYILRANVRFSRDPVDVERSLEDLRLAHKLNPADREAATALRKLRYLARGPKDLGCHHEHESEHYRVVTDISPQAAKLYAERLEAAFRHYSEYFQHVPQERVVRKPRVAIFNTRENYYTYCELLSESGDRGVFTLGHFKPEFNELVLFEDVDLDETLHTLYHEAFHHFTTLMVKHRMPYWWNEGIAEYMGAVKIQDGKVVEKARVLKGRLDYLQLMARFGNVFAFEKIMGETPSEFYSGDVGLKYAQAWSMVHFFYEFENGKHRGLIEKYFDEMRAKKTPKVAFDAVFKDAAAALENEWKEFVKKLKA